MGGELQQMTWDPEAVGKAALLAHPRTQLVVSVNSRENFVHWARGIAYDAIIGSAQLDDPDGVTAFVKFIADKKFPDRVAAAVYDELRRGE